MEKNNNKVYRNLILQLKSTLLQHYRQVSKEKWTQRNWEILTCMCNSALAVVTYLLKLHYFYELLKLQRCCLKPKIWLALHDNRPFANKTSSLKRGLVPCRLTQFHSLTIFRSFSIFFVVDFCASFWARKR